MNRLIDTSQLYKEIIKTVGSGDFIRTQIALYMPAIDDLVKKIQNELQNTFNSRKSY